MRIDVEQIDQHPLSCKRAPALTISPIAHPTTFWWPISLFFQVTVNFFCTIVLVFVSIVEKVSHFILPFTFLCNLDFLRLTKFSRKKLCSISWENELIPKLDYTIDKIVYYQMKSENYSNQLGNIISLSQGGWKIPLI